MYFKIIMMSVTRPCFTTTPDLHDQDQDHSVQDQGKDQDRFFWSQSDHVLRSTVSDHITANYTVISVSPKTSMLSALSDHPFL